MKENLRDDHCLIYGVEFTGQNGRRIYDADGLIAEVGVDDQTARNDFDEIYPWRNMHRCNTALIEGERYPSAFEGESHFSNTKADVFVYVPLFYYARLPGEFGGDEMILISDRKILKEMQPPKKFKRADGTFRDFVFLPAYTAGLLNGKPVSRSGFQPFITSLDGWMALTARMDEDMCIQGTDDDEIINVLLEVEFATRDPKSVMAGAIFADDVFPAGACDGVKASSGSPVSNADGKHPCKYRGIENPWGNQFHWRWDVIVSNRNIFVLDNPKNYACGEITDHYTKLCYQISARDGWLDKVGHDDRFPGVQLCTETAGTKEESNFGQYFWQWSDEGPYALLVGGDVAYGRNAGPRFCYVSDGPGISGWTIGAALSPA